ncbi:hypothetical protein [Muricoccus radiodurans]|uniref:hypothetical protein n=1 Tax=Muricoccus radiodurans TaxID=2231721 RepID=UPI003CED4B23
MRLALIGDSHVVALGNALTRDRDALLAGSGVSDAVFGKVFSFPQLLKPFFAVERGGVRLVERGPAGSLERVLGPGLLGPARPEIFGISMAYTTSLLLWSLQWQTHRPWRACPEGFQPVSDGVVRAMAEEHFRHILGFIAALRDQGLRLFAVEAPPPREDHPYVGRTISAEAMLAVDRLARGRVREALDGMGVETVGVPDPAYGGVPGRSFLAAPFRSLAEGDYHHANEAYGALMLPAVLARAAEIGAARAAA